MRPGKEAEGKREMVRQDKGVTSRAAQARVASGQVVKHAFFGVLHRSPARAVHVSCRPAWSRTAVRAVVALPVAGVLLVVILALGLHVNLSASAPRGLYQTVAGRPTRWAWVVA